MINSKHRVLVKKMDEKPHYEWSPSLIINEQSFRMTAWQSPRDLLHHTKSSTFTFNNDAIEFFWSGLPFSIGLSYDTINQDIIYYCNIHLPCVFEDELISFIDLDLDVVKRNDDSAKIIDWDDFEHNKKLFSYSEKIEKFVPEIAEKLKDLLNKYDPLQTGNLRKVFIDCNQSNGSNLKLYLDPIIKISNIWDGPLL
jgi:uncharacterized protein